MESKNIPSNYIPRTRDVEETSEFEIYHLYATATWSLFKISLLWLIKQWSSVVFFCHLRCRVARSNRKLTITTPTRSQKFLRKWCSTQNVDVLNPTTRTKKYFDPLRQKTEPFDGRVPCHLHYLLPSCIHIRCMEIRSQNDLWWNEKCIYQWDVVYRQNNSMSMFVRWYV